MNSPNTFENSKEATFSALRRGCLDLRKSTDSLESATFSNDMIEDAWLFLMELSKAKLRRKHALECINIMMTSSKWVGVLRSSSRIKERIGSISKDMQIALGHKVDTASPTTPLSPAPSPPIGSSSRRNLTPQLPPPTRQKSKLKKVVNATPILPTNAARPDPVAPQHSIAPTSTVTALPGPTESNPFKMDFNPFKEARGTKIRSNPYSRPRNPTWWDEKSDSKPLSSTIWW
jgi:hypothetical protein